MKYLIKNYTVREEFIMYIYYAVVVSLFGIIIGSFLNVCIYRLPKGESIITPPSHCGNCGRRLGVLDLIPILSYVFLRGRCRTCKAGISIRYPAVELLTGLVFLSLYLKYNLTVNFVSSAFIMAILIAVFFIDIDHRIIPDELVIAGLVGGVLLVLYNIFKPVWIYSDRAWWNPLLGILVGSGFLLLVAFAGLLIYKTDEAMGMGDVKILAPIGIFLGWRMTLISLFITIIMSGIIGIILIVFKIKDRKSTIPFGPYIVVGTFITLMWGWDLLNIYLNYSLGINAR
jgi:leader peptidase (prepilin peptidase) / N-methyltransferase